MKKHFDLVETCTCTCRPIVQRCILEPLMQFLSLRPSSMYILSLQSSRLQILASQIIAVSNLHTLDLYSTPAKHSLRKQPCVVKIRFAFSFLGSILFGPCIMFS